MSTIHRISSIQLDEPTGLRKAPEIEMERTAAVNDLLAENYFDPHLLGDGPYAVQLSVRENRVVFAVTSEDAPHAEPVALSFSLQPLKSLIKDYFLICQSYYTALQSANTARLEAIDMGRRGLHNEASEVLMDLLSDKAKTDHATARRLFTLICALMLKDIG